MGQEESLVHRRTLAAAPCQANWSTAGPDPSQESPERADWEPETESRSRISWKGFALQQNPTGETFHLTMSLSFKTLTNDYRRLKIHFYTETTRQNVIQPMLK